MYRKNCLQNKFVVCLLVFSLLCSILAACSPIAESSDPSPELVTFTDALGREVSLPKNPKRVAALIGSFADIWTLAGGTVCATADDAWDDFGLDLPDAINLGSTKSPSLEALFSSDPDLVLASSATAKNVEWREILEQAKIPVAYFDVACFEDYLHMLKICTDLTGRSDLYEQNGTQIQTKIDQLKANFSVENLPEAQRSVLFLRASSGYIRAKNSHGSILGEMLQVLGCKNIADSDTSLLENLSIESILRADPYRIFIVQVGDDTAAVQKNLSTMMEENPAWQDLSAVKADRVHIMDKRLFNLKPNARWAEAYEKLCEILQNEM